MRTLIERIENLAEQRKRRHEGMVEEASGKEMKLVFGKREISLPVKDSDLHDDPSRGGWVFQYPIDDLPSDVQKWFNSHRNKVDRGGMVEAWKGRIDGDDRVFKIVLIAKWTKFDGLNFKKFGDSPFIATPKHGMQNSTEWEIYDSRNDDYQRDPPSYKVSMSEVHGWLVSLWKNRR